MIRKENKDALRIVKLYERHRRLTMWWNGAPERIRTSDPQIRSLVLYPAELRARGAGKRQGRDIGVGIGWRNP